MILTNMSDMSLSRQMDLKEHGKSLKTNIQYVCVLLYKIIYSVYVSSFHYVHIQPCVDIEY